MLIAVLLLGVTVELTTNEPIRQPTVIADGDTMEMHGAGRLWHGNLGDWPALISATFEDLAGNRGFAEWESSWTPTPTLTPTDTPPPPPAPPAIPTATATPVSASPEAGEPAATPTPTVSPTPSESPTPSLTPTPTIEPHSWQTTGSFGWRYTGEILEATHARFAGHDGFLLEDWHVVGESDGGVARAEWEVLPGRHTITYRWRIRVREYKDVIRITFRENGWPVDTEVVSEGSKGRALPVGAPSGAIEKGTEP